MPRFNEQWRYEPFGDSESGPRRIWVQRLPQYALSTSVRLRETVLEEPEEPESTLTVRVRYQSDISTRGRFTDPDGREWYVNGFEEVGRRRRFVDVSLSYFGLLLSEDAIPPQQPPEGWRLEDADGWVATVRIGKFCDGNLRLISDNDVSRRRGFFVRVPSLPATGWRVSGAWSAGEIRRGFPVDVFGANAFMTGFSGIDGQGGLSFDGNRIVKAFTDRRGLVAQGLWPYIGDTAIGQPDEFGALTIVDDRFNPSGVSQYLEFLNPADEIEIVGDEGVAPDANQ